ncbi:MAG: peptidyl-prolyl cis-trans isomerase [Myxococcota bacterium]
MPTRAEVLEEVRRLPPVLREQFETENGQREFLRAMQDKRLLAAEARRRNLAAEPTIAKQVRELEERLIIQKLLEIEESKSPVTEEEARTWFEANKEMLKQPERVRVVRVLAAAKGASSGDLQTARTKAERFRRRLTSGEATQKVAPDGDGPESARGGDLGFIQAGDHPDKALEAAAFSLKNRGDVSEVVKTQDGYAVLVLTDRREARIPSYDEVRSDVIARMEPQRKRKVFNEVIRRLREASSNQAALTP